MPEVLSPETRVAEKIFRPFCNEVFHVYPNARYIQEGFDEDTQTFSCNIEVEGPISVPEEEAMQGGILSMIQKHILPTLPAGFTTTIKDITLTVKKAHATTPEVSAEADMQVICDSVEQKFRHEKIRVEYQPGHEKALFIVSGSKPLDHDSIRAAIISSIPHMMQCPASSIRFQSHFSAEQARETSTAPKVTIRMRDLFADVLLSKINF